MNLFIAVCCPLLLFLEKYNTSTELTVFFFFQFVQSDGDAHRCYGLFCVV